MTQQVVDTYRDEVVSGKVPWLSASRMRRGSVAANCQSSNGLHASGGWQNRDVTPSTMTGHMACVNGGSSIFQAGCCQGGGGGCNGVSGPGTGGAGAAAGQRFSQPGSPMHVSGTTFGASFKVEASAGGLEELAYSYFEPLGERMVKGKGAMVSYLVKEGAWRAGVAELASSLLATTQSQMILGSMDETGDGGRHTRETWKHTSASHSISTTPSAPSRQITHQMSGHITHQVSGVSQLGVSAHAPPGHELLSGSSHTQPQPSSASVLSASTVLFPGSPRALNRNLSSIPHMHHEDGAGVPPPSRLSGQLSPFDAAGLTASLAGLHAELARLSQQQDAASQQIADLGPVVRQLFTLAPVAVADSSALQPLPPSPFLAAFGSVVAGQTSDSHGHEASAAAVSSVAGATAALSAVLRNIRACVGDLDTRISQLSHSVSCQQHVADLLLGQVPGATVAAPALPATSPIPHTPTTSKPHTPLSPSQPAAAVTAVTASVTVVPPSPYPPPLGSPAAAAAAKAAHLLIFPPAAAPTPATAATATAGAAQTPHAAIPAIQGSGLHEPGQLRTWIQGTSSSRASMDAGAWSPGTQTIHWCVAVLLVPGAGTTTCTRLSTPVAACSLCTLWQHSALAVLFIAAHVMSWDAGGALLLRNGLC